jgi:hypothetical protein
MRRPPLRKWKFLVVTVAVAALGVGVIGQSGGKPPVQNHKDRRMSAMGAAAADAVYRVAAGVSATDFSGNPDREVEPGECHNDPRCGSGFRDGPLGNQAELSIAVDATGQHVVVGFNDHRGFSSNPVSLSGFMYSDDGGVTFVEGGQLPSPGTDTIGSTRFPQIFGDPDIEYVGGCTFIYSSIMVKKFSATTAVQTMSVHRSVDCGHTWQGPFEVTAATNPNGAVDASGNPEDAADKEFISLDPETGRVIMSWSNFTPFAAGGVEIATTYSDDILAATPTWSPRRVVAAGPDDGQGSNPAFAAGSGNAYVAWARFPFPGTFGGYGNVIGFSRSTDNGVTWSAPANLTPEFVTMDHVLGNDRVHTFPGIAVDNSGGAHAGNVYVVYVNNNSLDGSDIVFQRSTDGGVSFSPPILLNSRPGNDRSQWFPWVNVDKITGRVHVIYYDQGIRTSGDPTEAMHTYSDDGGISWAAPLPLSARPFNAGWGNDTSQPNLGDYNQAVAQHGTLYYSFAGTARPPLGFVDGQPSTAMTVPDVIAGPYSPPRSLTLDLQGVTFTDSGANGYLDPGETASFRFALRNYVTNPLNAQAMVGVKATLSTTTPGVVVTQSRAPYTDIAPGGLGNQRRDFRVQLLPSFVPGTPIEFRLDIDDATLATKVLLHTQFTGTPVPTVLLSENFDGVAPGALPAGWSAVHGAGTVTVPWITSNTFCGSSNGAFHANDNVGATSAQRTRIERLFSPSFDVPANAEYLDVEFDVCYDTEEDPNFNVLAYDGFFLRLTDLTPGRTLRSVLAEAFADEFTTGALLHYPRHLPRSGNTSYFQDMSAWAGDSSGVKHVRMRLPGVAGSTMQLRFEYTQDGIVTCADLRPGNTCGVFVDNVVVESVVSAP